MTDRYKLLSNFIHNEMKLTKAEVETWFKEEIGHQVKERINRIPDEVIVNAVQQHVNALLSVAFGSPINPGPYNQQAVKKAVTERVDKVIRDEVHDWLRTAIKVEIKYPDITEMKK